MVPLVDNESHSRVLPLVGLSSVLLTVMVIVLVVTTLISRSSQVRCHHYVGFRETQKRGVIQQFPHLVVVQYLKERGLRTHVGFNQSVDRHIEPDAQVLLFLLFASLLGLMITLLQFCLMIATSHRKEERQW